MIFEVVYTVGGGPGDDKVDLKCLYLKRRKKESYSEKSETLSWPISMHFRDAP